jgi:signal transduction histidine kinase
VENLTICQTLQMVAKKHEQLTGTRVECDVNGLEQTVSFPIKTCLYRFAQEGLNNAYRHAGAAGQALRARNDRDATEIWVSDQGPPTPIDEPPVGTGSQGLSGLRLRVESLGGTFRIQSGPGQGTTLSPAGSKGSSPPCRRAPSIEPLQGHVPADPVPMAGPQQAARGWARTNAWDKPHLT